MILGICCVAGLIITGDTDERMPHAGPYPEDDEYRAYMNSVYNGLAMSYEEYLAEKYPQKISGTLPDVNYYVDIRPIISEQRKVTEAGRFILITEQDFVTHPALGKLLTADTPFSTVRLTQEEYGDLHTYFQNDDIIEWNGTLYQPFAVSGIMLGAAALAGGLFLFACTRKKISDDPASRAMQIAEYIKIHPGCSMNDITASTGFSRGSASYNLHRLKSAGYVQTITRRGIVRHYSCRTEMNTTEEFLSDILAKEKPARIFTEILSLPGVTQKELAGRTGLPVSTVQWNPPRQHLDSVVRPTR